MFCIEFNFVGMIISNPTSDQIHTHTVNTIRPERNEMLEQELSDMKQLMYVVAPQHYIDDEYSNSLQYTNPTEMQYECFSNELHDISSQVSLGLSYF